MITRIGKLELRVPRDRDGRFSTELFARYQRSEKALVAALAQMYVQGGAPGKTPFVAAVQGNEEEHPIAMRLTKVKRFRKDEIAAWAQRHLLAASIVASDGLSRFAEVKATGCEHDAIATGGGPAGVDIEAFTWVNTMIGNVKNSIHGTYHAVSDRHVPRYLVEFCCRFNRRFELPAMIPRLGYIATRTPPMPERPLRLTEPWG